MNLYSELTNRQLIFLSCTCYFGWSCFKSRSKPTVLARVNIADNSVTFKMAVNKMVALGTLSTICRYLKSVISNRTMKNKIVEVIVAPYCILHISYRFEHDRVFWDKKVYLLPFGECQADDTRSFTFLYGYIYLIRQWLWWKITNCVAISHYLTLYHLAIHDLITHRESSENKQIWRLDICDELNNLSNGI